MPRSSANAGLDPNQPMPTSSADLRTPTRAGRAGAPLVPILAAIVLAGALGGGAWWWYHHRGAMADRGDRAAAAPASPSDRPPVEAAVARASAEGNPLAAGAASSASEVAALRADLDALTRRLDQLQQRLSALPDPASAPDLGAIKSRLDALAGLPEQVGPLPDRLHAAEQRLDKLEQGSAFLRQEVAALRGEVQKAGPAAAAPKLAGDELRTAMDQFDRRQYNLALASLRRLEQDFAQDARVWYYAALARGFATGDWAGETQRLANEGVARERAGTPPRPVIDAAFAGLSEATGAGWLAYYRRQAQQQEGDQQAGAAPPEDRR